MDVIRAPLRPVDLPGCVEAAQELVRLTIHPVQCTLVVASFVPGEWRTNAETEVEKVRIHVAGVDEETKRLHGFHAVLGIVPQVPAVEYRLLCLNRRDYCAKGSSRLHPALAADFLAAGLTFATSLPWAINEIKNP